MTIVFGDASEFNGTFPDGPVMVARATISNIRDARYDQWRTLAAQRGRPFMAYAFLNHDSLTSTPTSGGPAIPAEAQADFAYSVIGPDVPCMLDWESNRGMSADVGMAWRFINRYRSHGGRLHVYYLPQWYWQNHLGAPDLRPFRQAGLHLVSSNYTAYSDTGPGWAPYGGVTPDQWQFTNNWLGSGVDGNAFKGTPEQWWAMVTGDDMALTDLEMEDLYRRVKNLDSFVYYGIVLGQPTIPASALSYGVPPNDVAPAQDQPFALNAKVDQLAAPQVTVTVDQAALVAALQTPAVLAAIAKAVNDDAAARLAG